MLSRRRLLVLWLVPHLRPAARANPANGDPRLEKLYLRFIAPCCWRENLLVHQSPKADELRAEIKRLVSAGKSDDEIRDQMVGNYSLRILSEPEGALSRWLSWTPVATALAGLGVVSLVIRRSLRSKPPHPAVPSDPAQLPDLPPEFDN